MARAIDRVEDCRSSLHPPSSYLEILRIQEGWWKFYGSSIAVIVHSLDRSLWDLLSPWDLYRVPYSVT